MNRAVKVTISFGGKGANTARMVRQLGANPMLIEFVGGSNGRLLEEMLVSEEVVFRHVEVAGETRICQTLVEQDNPEPTELVEEMPPITSMDWKKMVELFQTLELEGAVVPVAGKLPAGAPVDAYALMTALVADAGGRVILDTLGEPLLQALEHQPFIVKINEEELLQTLGGGGLMAACHQVIERGAQSVLITRGSRSAIFVDRFQSLELFPPKIHALNPIGSGDAVTAGMAVALNDGRELSDALVYGMACGAANALSLCSGVLSLDDVKRLHPSVRVG